MVPVRKRLRAALAMTVAALVVPGLAVTASAASASSLSTIDPDRTGTLTITAQARVGENSQPVLVEGVTFTVERVEMFGGEDVDLRTAKGWQTIEGISATDAAGDRATRVPVRSVTTGADGRAVLDGLALGLYYVTETGHRTDVASRTVPFLVTIPYPDEDVVGGWLYTVDVVPKSSVVTADKTVDDAKAVALGDRVTWTVTGSVPEAGVAGHPLSRYVVTDVLDPRLAYVDGTFRVTTKPNDVGLRDTEDYTVGFDPSTRTATIAFTASGLAKLATIAGPAATLSVSGDTTVVEIGDGTIENTAELLIGDAELTAQAVSEWGSLEIYKYADGDGDASLAGAVFQAFASADDAKNRTNPLRLVVNGSPVSTFTTGTDGTVLLPGLRAGTTVHLVEIEAPAGYTAAGTIEPVIITTGENQVKIANVQRDGVTLPVLGAQGMALAGVLGLGLMGGGAGLAVASKRRKARAHN